MHSYELVAIISPEIDEEGIARIIDEVDRCVTKRGGTASETRKWGKRKLAYPIKKFMEGNYISTQFKLEPKLIKETAAEIGAPEEVLRHLIVKAGD